MLRIIVISLVVANLFLLGFQGSAPEVKKEVVAPKRVSGDPRIPTIHLFSEIIEDHGLLNSNRQCYSIGPFHSETDRDEVFDSLLDVSNAVIQRETQALVEKGYWVFMPPYVSLLEANEELLSLKALGLNDISIIYDGDWQNAISLGYFLRQANAQRRKKALEERGFQPMIRVQRQSEYRYWLDYELPPGSALLTLDMTGRPNDFMQRPLPCPEERMPVVSKAVETPAPTAPEMFDEPGQQEPVAETIIPGAQADQASDQQNADGEEAGQLEDQLEDLGPPEGEPDAPVETTAPADDGAAQENPDATDTDG